MYSSRSSFWMLSSICIYCCSNCYNTSFAVSFILSLVSSISPSVNTMGSPCDLSDFCFFLGPPCCSLPRLFRIIGVLYPSSPSLPCFDNSSSLVSGEGDFPLLCDLCYSCSLAAHSFAIRAFSTASFFLCVAHLDASFLFYTTEIHVPLLALVFKSKEAHFSAGHHVITSYMFVSFPKYGKSCHFYCGSFRA